MLTQPASWAGRKRPWPLPLATGGRRPVLPGCRGPGPPCVSPAGGTCSVHGGTQLVPREARDSNRPGSGAAGDLARPCSPRCPLGARGELLPRTPAPKPRGACGLFPHLGPPPGPSRPSPVASTPPSVSQPPPLHRPRAAGNFAAPREVADIITFKIVLIRAGTCHILTHVFPLLPGSLGSR